MPEWANRHELTWRPMAGLYIPKLPCLWLYYTAVVICCLAASTMLILYQRQRTRQHCGDLQHTFKRMRSIFGYYVPDMREQLALR